MMAVIRVNKSKDFTVMSNTHFREREMSLKAKGLLSLMLSLPDDWNYSVEGLTVICKENETAIKSTLDELKQFGYLTVVKKFPNETKSGRFEYEYNVYEQPQGKQAVEKQGIENLPLEFLPIENQGQYNTNLPNTEEVNTKGLNKEESVPKTGTPKPSPAKSPIDYELFKNTYNEICTNLSKIKLLSEKRKQAIRDFLKQLTFDDFKQACEIANELDFTTGKNDRGWKADFDFLITVDKALRVLEDKYADNKPKKETSAPGFDLDEFFNAAVLDSERKRMENPPKTAADDEAVRRRAEELKRRL